MVLGHNLLGGTGPIGSLASAGSAARVRSSYIHSSQFALSDCLMVLIFI